MDSEDGELFIKQLATFVRTHEKALANALQNKANVSRHGSLPSESSVSSGALATSPTLSERPSTSASTSSSIAAALALGSLSLTSNTVKSTRLALTPHHLFYLLSRFEELGIPVGPMKVRLENLHDTGASANYVSFLSQSQRSKSRASDAGSIRSVSSIRSVVSGISALWTGFGIGSSISTARTERQKAALEADLKYLYSAFTKIPCLRLAPDWRARLIRGYEEFPFDSAVPLYVFKNVQSLEVSDMDFRQFFGWDKMADQLRSLTLKRASIDDPADILIDIVLDDMDKRRKRTSKAQASPTAPWAGSPSPRRNSMAPPVHPELRESTSAPGSPDARKSTADLAIGCSINSQYGPDHNLQNPRDCRRMSLARADDDDGQSKSAAKSLRPRSHSPRRLGSSVNGSSSARGGWYKVRRSGSGSSQSSLSDTWHHHRSSSSNLLAMSILPSIKWRFLRHLSLADNSLISLSAAGLAPLANTLHSLDMSSNLFSQVPDSLASLTALRALNLAHCMIDSLHSLTRNPLPAITALNLRANRLQSLAGIERLYPLERLDLRDNRLTDPSELARLTGIPDIREVWVGGNPFTRTHRDYRLTIFNLFRKTPGFTEDMTIDASGPSYSEKRYLVERIAMPAAVPVVKPQPPEVPAVDVSKITNVYDAAARGAALLRKERPALKTTTSEVNTSSTSRPRRAPKRRIVDLAASDHNAPPAQLGDVSGDGHGTSALAPENHYRVSQTQEVQKLAPTVLAESPLPSMRVSPEIPRIDTSVVSELSAFYPSRDSPLWKDDTEWDVGGEIYRRKIEALRDRVGNGYLNVFNEEGWDGACPPNYHDPAFGSASSLHRPTTASRTTNLQTMRGGRTLG